MAEVSPDTIGTIIGVSIGVLSFFASNAIGQIREYQNGYLKFSAGFALFLSYFVLLALVGTAFSVGVFTGRPLLMTGLWFVFIAFYLPSLFLFIPLAQDISDMAHGDQLENKYLLAIVLILIIIVYFLIEANPSG